MEFNPLFAISPIDGRYRKQTEEVSQYFSESALIKYRLKIEILYLTELSRIKIIRKLKPKEKQYLTELYTDFKLRDAQKVKQIEKEIKHDVKAVEYFIKQRLEKTSLKDLKEFVHFALTSEDINNLAYDLMIKDALRKECFPALDSLIKKISQLAKKYKDVAMLAHTHGQPASPTTVGKELAIFAYRLKNQLKTFPELTGKLNGAVGNYNAHVVAYPQKNWIKFSQKYIKKLGLKPNLLTTQIENHDCLAELFHAMIRINNIILDLNHDFWTYISLDYLKQRVVKKEIGSSTMPHKINPINFENSEGNLGIANSLLNHLANKLPISRMQRDLSDSTATRNIGIAMAYSILAFKSSIAGLNKITLNRSVITADLEKHPEILAEAIQIILRREKVVMPYEALKELVRGSKITLSQLHRFIDNLKITNKVKKELKNITVENYTGLATKLTRLATKA